jgi:hypothetical protein
VRRFFRPMRNFSFASHGTDKELTANSPAFLSIIHKFYTNHDFHLCFVQCGQSFQMTETPGGGSCARAL